VCLRRRTQQKSSATFGKTSAILLNQGGSKRTVFGSTDGSAAIC
jgi:hypothetical protein